MDAAKALVRSAFTVDAVAQTLATFRGSEVTVPVIALARRIVKKFGEGKRPRIREVASFLHGSAAFRRVILAPPKTAADDEETVFLRLAGEVTHEIDIEQNWEVVMEREVELGDDEVRMIPAAGAPEGWAVPAITTTGELRAWLGLEDEVLRWLRADWRSDHEAGGRLRHYRFHWVPRRGRAPRLIEAPLPLLKRVQRRILQEILDNIPAHPAAHGFVKGRSTVSFAQPHTGQRCVLRMDVQDFFPTIRRARVVRIFMSAGYPEPVAIALADLCTTATPMGVLGSVELDWERRQMLRSRHLPQGAPTSPTLANLCAFALDSRLSGLARKFEANYTRYADDLVFSGGESFRRNAARCEVLVGGILLEEGFTAAHRKTKIMPSSVSQRAAGLVLNEKPALPRRERDLLKAILTNCLRHGPDSQNRCGLPDFRAHLQGRIAHAAHLSPASGAKLRGLFDAISWG